MIASWYSLIRLAPLLFGSQALKELLSTTQSSQTYDISPGPVSKAPLTSVEFLCSCLVRNSLRYNNALENLASPVIGDEITDIGSVAASTFSEAEVGLNDRF
ncbi:hypothetical protein BDD12DRAFT_825793 [Trichophaea hybrida]|nr:hypothetical protein BDD12DRAFT_825793 [Trichophaea hybrida]